MQEFHADVKSQDSGIVSVSLTKVGHQTFFLKT